jgi:hypothetical protein
MHARVNRRRAVVVTAGAAMLFLLITATPSWADKRSGTVTPSDAGLLARVRSQVNELNRYVSSPTPCTDIDDAAGMEDRQGVLRWRSPILSQESWLNALDATSGVAYRLECWGPESGEYGRLIDVRVFPDINAENLARLAMDEFLLGLPAPEPHLNPSGTTLVNLDTWLSVDNIPQGTLTSPPVTVPGITVIVRATASGVEWRMGDGTAPFICSGTGHDSGTCSHAYRRSSASQPGGQYHGVASVVWTGTYTINGVSGGAEIPVPRASDFSIQVAEGQAVVVR